MPKEIIQSLLNLIRNNGSQENIADDSKAYLMDDMTAIFAIQDDGKSAFAGLSFDMLGRDFHILPSLEIMITEYGEEGEEVYSVEDEQFGRLIIQYLSWRAEVIKAIKM